MSLENILKQIKVVKPLAEDPLDGPMETMGARKGRKFRSQEELGNLRRQYREDLLRSSVFVIVTGSLRDEFQALASGDKFKVFSADPERFYTDLATRIPPVLYQGKATVGELFDVLGRHLEDKAGELDIVGYPQLIFKDSYTATLENPAAFQTLVKKAINEQMGSEVVGIQAVESIVDSAIEVGHDKKTTSIILNTGDQTLILDLLRDLPRLTTRIFLVVAGKSTKVLRGVEDAILVNEVTEETMKKTLNTIRESIKL